LRHQKQERWKRLRETKRGFHSEVNMSNVVLSDFKGSGQFPRNTLVENHERFHAFVGSKIDEFSWEQFYVSKPHQQRVNWRTNNLPA